MRGGAASVTAKTPGTIDQAAVTARLGVEPALVALRVLPFLRADDAACAAQPHAHAEPDATAQTAQQAQARASGTGVARSRGLAVRLSYATASGD